MLCVTRKPSNTSTEPSSIRVGTETQTAFLHSERTFSMFSPTSIRPRHARQLEARHLPRVFLQVGGDAAVERGHVVSLLRSSLDREDGLRGRGRRAVVGVHRVRAEPEHVGAVPEHAPARIPAGEAEGVAAGKHVAETGEHPELLAAGRPELHLEQADGLDPLAAGERVDPPGPEGEHGRRRVGRRELAVRERRRRRRAARRSGARRDRPRDPHRAGALRRDDEHAARLPAGDSPAETSILTSAWLPGAS